MNPSVSVTSRLDVQAERASAGAAAQWIYDEAARLVDELGVDDFELTIRHVGCFADSPEREAVKKLFLAHRYFGHAAVGRPGPALLHRIGLLLASVGLLDPAAECFRKSLDEMTDDADRKTVLWNLIVVELERRDFDAAIEIVRQLATLAPSLVDAADIPPPAILRVQAGALRGREFTITGPESIIGRNADCDVEIDSRMVSRRHARLRCENNAWTIEDAGSAGGTFVNERRVESPTALKDGDCIRLADVELWFSLPSEDVPAPSMVEDEADVPSHRDTDVFPLYLDENVQFTVYRPRSIVPNKWHPLLAFAHLSDKPPDAGDDDPDPVEEVQRQAAMVLGERAEDYQDTTQDSLHAVPRQGELTMIPQMDGVEFNPERRTFTWEESVHREEFRMKAGADLVGTTLRGRLTVYLGGIILADVPLVVRVSASEEARPEPKLEPESARPYRKIFASYSHQDLPIVEQFEQYVGMLGDEYLRDWKHLRSGQVWNDRLMEMIREADVFQLFWSRNSMRSPYVRQEWEYALSLARPHFVRPTYWEDPLPEIPEENLPPDVLRRLHFQRLGAAVAPTSGSPSAQQPLSSAGASPSNLDDLKKRLHLKLIDKLDLSRIAEIDAETLRRELHAVAEHILDSEDELLTRVQRERLIEECLNESLGLRRTPASAPTPAPTPIPAPTPAPIPARKPSGDLAMRGGDDDYYLPPPMPGDFGMSRRDDDTPLKSVASGNLRRALRRASSSKRWRITIVAAAIVIVLIVWSLLRG